MIDYHKWHITEVNDAYPSLAPFLLLDFGMAKLTAISLLGISLGMLQGTNHQEWSLINPSEFGEVAAICPLGDVDGDGISDFALGWPQGQQSPGWNGGLASIHSGRTGQLLRALGGRQGSALVGSSLSCSADFDNDGLPD